MDPVTLPSLVMIPSSMKLVGVPWKHWELILSLAQMTWLPGVIIVRWIKADVITDRRAGRIGTDINQELSMLAI